MKANTERKGVFDALESLIQCIGHVVCWFNGLLVIVIVLQVLLRYVFGRGLVMLEELEWHLYAAGFLFGLSYAVTKNSNVRVDLVQRRFSKQTREWIEAIGILVLLLPFIIVIFLHSLEFTRHSWTFSEESQAPLGLPCRWIIKSIIPISFVLLAAAAVARLVRAFDVIRRKNDHGSN
jgi:TRAP-type mannitol/chloroaromatic compound transport system permease small subunit